MTAVATTHLVAGIYRGISFPEYIALPAVSRSMLWAMGVTPAHTLAAIMKPPTEAMRNGIGLHTMTLEGEDAFRERCWIRKFREKRSNCPAGMIEIDEKDAKDIVGMSICVWMHQRARRLLNVPDEWREVVALWQDEETGLWCKARADAINEDLGVIPDLKSTDDASPEEFPRKVDQYGYDGQAAWYVDGFRKCGVEVNSFALVTVEKSALWPGRYPVAVYELKDRVVANGRAKCRERLAKWAEWLRLYGPPSQAWPDYDSTIYSIQ